MSMATTPTIERGATLRMRPHELPQGLRQLWQSACPATEGADVARSLTINFLALATADREASLRDVIGRLLRRTPCRAFLLVIDEQASTPTAELTASTRCSGNLRDIVLEEIMLRLPPGWFAHLPGLLRPLLVNDLPNHLYWSGPWRRNSPWFAMLAGLCEHSMVDSRDFDAPAADLAAVETERSKGQQVTDLNWLRLRPWRRALAEAYQRVPHADASDLTASIQHGPTATSSAILLGNWLSQRLQARVQYQPAEDDRNTGPVAIELRSDRYEILARARENHIRLHVATETACHLPFQLPRSRGSEGDLLAAAIDLA